MRFWNFSLPNYYIFLETVIQAALLSSLFCFRSKRKSLTTMDRNTSFLRGLRNTLGTDIFAERLIINNRGHPITYTQIFCAQKIRNLSFIGCYWNEMVGMFLPLK